MNNPGLTTRTGQMKGYGPMKAWIGMLAVALPLAVLPTQASAQASAQAAHGLSMAEDLRAESAQAQSAGKPLVLMFSLPECGYCKVVRQHYLLPMIRDAAADPPQVRELTMTGRSAITDFDGTVTTPAALARRYGVKVAPTLVFVNAAGEVLVDPLVGGDHQFYSAYLDRAFDESTRKLGSKRVRPR